MNKHYNKTFEVTILNNQPITFHILVPDSHSDLLGPKCQVHQKTLFHFHLQFKSNRKSCPVLGGLQIIRHPSRMHLYYLC